MSTREQQCSETGPGPPPAERLRIADGGRRRGGPTNQLPVNEENGQKAFTTTRNKKEYGADCAMKREGDRRKTFRELKRYLEWQQMSNLTRKGYYYIESLIQVKCFSCGATATIDLSRGFTRINSFCLPHCKFAQGLESGNVPLTDTQRAIADEEEKEAVKNLQYGDKAFVDNDESAEDWAADENLDNTLNEAAPAEGTASSRGTREERDLGLVTGMEMSARCASCGQCLAESRQCHTCGTNLSA